MSFRMVISAAGLMILTSIPTAKSRVTGLHVNGISSLTAPSCEGLNVHSFLLDCGEELLNLQGRSSGLARSGILLSPI